MSKGIPKNPEEARAKRVASLKKYWSNPENRAKQSAIQKIIQSRPEVKAKQSAAKIGDKNSAKRPEVRAKISVNMQRRWDDLEERNRLIAAMRASAKRPERKARSSAAAIRRWKDPEYRKKTLDAFFEAIQRKPSKPEKELDILLQKLFPGRWRYTGDASFWVTSNGKHLNPDFISIVGQKKIIEFNGDYWHSEKVTGRTKEEEEQQRIDLYAQLGYQTLIIWESELKNVKMLEKKIFSFVRTNSMKLFIIDGFLWIHRSFHASVRAGLTSDTGEPTGATHIFMTSLLKLIREEEPDLLCVAMEGGGKIFRHEISSDYKANRSIPVDDFTIQRLRIEQILSAMNIPILRTAGFEADDIIGTVAKYAQEDGIDVVICSKDKDMLQLVDEGIEVFYAKTGEYIDVVRMIEKIGVSPNEFVDCLALQGDAADNVIGVPGIGLKTAAKLIRKYGSIENLIEHLHELKGKQQVNLIEHKDRLIMNKLLVTIDCDVPFDFDYYDLMLDGYDEDKLRDIFTELGLNQIMAQMDLEE